MPMQLQPISILSYEELWDLVDAHDSKAYARTRNYLSGAVSRLSPYISRGVLSVIDIIDHLNQQNKLNKHTEKWVQQLLWREFWQQQWFVQDHDLNTESADYQNKSLVKAIPCAVLDAQTGIQAIDKGIKALYNTGYMHNHTRLYVAALSCNVAKVHWHAAAKWLYYHLLDGDWASNALSWKWVAGASRNRQYWMNQENINRYSNSDQQGSYLDQNYDDIVQADVPMQLENTTRLTLTTKLPTSDITQLDPTQAIALYTTYNLDPLWLKEKQCQRILLLEPSHFRHYPISEAVLSFMITLARKMIPTIQIWVADFSSFSKGLDQQEIFYKQHPFSAHFKGHMTARKSLLTTDRVYTQYFKYYQKVKKNIGI
eukprot:COSAG02_NODE_8899_length_2405_cov_1.740243_2_plen_371_part_00